MYLSDSLFKNARLHPSKTALIASDRRFNWSQLASEVESAVAALAVHAPADRQRLIAIFLPNGWQYVVAYLAIVHLGHAAVPIDISFKKLEVDFVLEAVKPDLVIADERTMSLVNGPAILADGILRAKHERLSDTYRDSPETQIATIFLSSGTTGAPKPIPNTHTNQLWDIEAIAKPLGWTKKDNVLITLHLSHRHGLVICLLSAIYHGNTIYLTDRFSVERTIDLLESGKISVYSTVPAVYEQLVKYAPKKKVNFSKVRLFASSSSPMPPALARAFKDRYSHDIADRYGTSETGSISIRSASDGEQPSQLLKDVSVRIEPSGEIAVRSPGLFPGYYKNSGATKKGLTEDGWWLPGDSGELNGNKLTLLGRSGERINRSGYSLYPSDIEWALKKNPSISDVKIISTSSPNSLDDEVVAFFAGRVSIESLADFSRQNLPRSWRPDKYIKLDALPKTANGKISLVKLHKMLEKESQP